MLTVLIHEPSLFPSCDILDILPIIAKCGWQLLTRGRPDGRGLKRQLKCRIEKRAECSEGKQFNFASLRH